MNAKAKRSNRDLLLRDRPELFYLTDHYLNYPAILLRLTHVTLDRLEELLEDARRCALTKSRRRV